MKKLFPLLLGLFPIISGCVVDNQKIVSKYDLKYANPRLKITSKHVAAHNGKHKILLAVIDTGVDYNHPLLRDHIHYTLGHGGQIVRAGYDYVGEDPWPAPYIVRTDSYNKDIQKGDRELAKKMALRAVNLRLRAAKDKESAYVSKFLSPSRSVEKETMAGAYHGTHVAGLMVYDQPALGLLPYRILPHSRGKKKKDHVSEFINVLSESIDRAVSDGARVINLSLGMRGKKVRGTEKEKIKKWGRYLGYLKILQYQKKISEKIQKHPDVLFVAAAGNDSDWSDGDNNFGFPCGIKAPNALCVGALTESGDPAPFTNLPISGVDLVFALGDKVKSAMPTNMCADSSLPAMVILESASMLKDVKKACPNTSVPLTTLSGTSMATPLVAHLAGEILLENPTLSAPDLIKSIYDRAVPSFIGQLPVLKLRVKKPSWYATPKPAMLGLAYQDSDPGYWEAVVTHKPATGGE